MGEIDDIRTGRRIREDNKKKEKYETRLVKHKASKFSVFIGFVVFIACFTGLVYWQYKNHVYTAYSVEKAIPFETVSGTSIKRVEDSILSYSRDGSHMTDQAGQSKWNVTYAIQDLMVEEAGGTVAIAAFNDRKIIVADMEKQICSITTAMPIQKISVSEAGYVTAVISNSEETYINTYDNTGKLIFNGKSHINTMGYPLALALSPNAQNLAISYLTMNGSEIKTKIVFYNFGAVGSNKADYIMGEYSYSDMVVPELVFLTDETSVAVGDSRIMFYTGALNPTLYAERLFEREVLSVFSGNGHIGVVFVSDSAESAYMIEVYDDSAKKLGTYYFDINYRDVFFEKDAFVIYNNDECNIFAYNGLKKFDGEFKSDVNLMLPTDKAYRYALVCGDEIQIIQMN